MSCVTSSRAPSALLILVFAIGAVAAAETFTAKVVEVAKGDVLTVKREVGNDTIRLAGVDCPELTQPHGPDAKQWTSALVLNKDITVQPLAKDQLNRTTALVTLPD